MGTLASSCFCELHQRSQAISRRAPCHGTSHSLTQGDAYFAAFCEKGNLLSQWRAYAGTQGFAVEVIRSSSKANSP